MSNINTQIQVVKNGVSDNYYPVTTASNTTVTSSASSNIPSSANTVQKALDALGELAFDDGDNLVYLSSGTSGSNSGLPTDTEVDDSTVSSSKTWSSAKIKTLFEKLGLTFDSSGNVTN